MKLSKIYSRMSNDELFNTYCDLGAMGAEMDCTPQEWQIICAEVERRTPILFRYVGIENEYDPNPDPNYGGYYPVPVDLTYQEALSAIKNHIKFDVLCSHGRELKYIPNCFLNSYWDDENKKLVAIPSIDVNELPF